MLYQLDFLLIVTGSQLWWLKKFRHLFFSHKKHLCDATEYQVLSAFLLCPNLTFFLMLNMAAALLRLEGES